MNTKGKKLKEIVRFLYRFRKTLLLIVIVAAITLVSSALIAIWLSGSYGVNVPSIGAIRVTGVEAFGGDTKLVSGVPSIDWGIIQFGEAKNVSFILRSTSNVPTRLAFNVTDWNPKGIKNYLTLSWNYNGTQIGPNQEIPVSFTLSTPGTRDFANYLITNSVESYNFTLNIYAEQ